MGDVKLSAPHVRVIRDGFPDPLEVQTDNRDMVLWDRTRPKHRWPGFQEGPVLWLTFLAWSAARRSGAIPADLKFESWEAQVLDITAIDDDESDDIGTPTPPGHEPG